VHLDAIDIEGNRCPCGAEFGRRRLEWKGEPIPDSVIIMQNVGPLAIKAIHVACANGHAYTAERHEWSARDGHRWYGLKPAAGAA